MSDSESDGDSDILIEEVDPVSLSDLKREEDDESDSDIEIEEVDPISLERTTTSAAEEEDDDDDIVIEEVEEDDEEDLPSVEFVRPPTSTSLVTVRQAPAASVDAERVTKEKREEGNALFSKKKFKEAIVKYAEGLAADPYDAKLYSNRSASFLALGRWREAKEDAEECTKLDPSQVKGWFRLGKASVMLEDFEAAFDACDKGGALVKKKTSSSSMRNEFTSLLRLARKEQRKMKRRKSIQKDLRELCLEMTPEERRWKAFWAGRGHPSVVDNSNLSRYVPDSQVDVSYDPDVSKALKGPDNLPRLDDDDEDDEDDLLLEEIIEAVDNAPARAVTVFEDEGCGPRSLLTCARIQILRETVLRKLVEDNHFFKNNEDDARDSSSELTKFLDTLEMVAKKQARDSLEKSWALDSLLKFPSAEVASMEGIGATYPEFAWRQKVNDIELRLLLPPFCSGRDLSVEICPRRIKVVVRRMRFWPYEKNSWTKIADVGPQLPEPVVLTEEEAPLVEEVFEEEDSDSDSDDDDDEPLVEELPFDDDDDTEDTVTVACAPPRALEEVKMTITWEEKGFVLKTLELEALPLVENVKSALERLVAVPTSLQRLSTPEGRLIFNDDDLLRHLGPSTHLILTEKKEEFQRKGEIIDDASAPTDIVLLDMKTTKKLFVDDSIWHVSKPEALKGHALQAPVLVMQLKKFQDVNKGTVRTFHLLPPQFPFRPATPANYGGAPCSSTPTKNVTSKTHRPNSTASSNNKYHVAFSSSSSLFSTDTTCFPFLSREKELVLFFFGFQKKTSRSRQSYNSISTIIFFLLRLLQHMT